jgi:2-polyprenyl-3-methyl-5-hydroxy-6-metoxy-1,4-benzoquinol methylase
MKREACAVCSNSLKNIYTIDNVPVKFFCTSTPSFDKSSLSFSQCDNCNTIQLDELLPLDVLYAESHNYVSVGKTWENYFELFCDKIQDLIEGKTILEIGCPSGKIARNVTNYNKWFIVEPNKNSEISFNEKIIFIEAFFDKDFVLDQQIDIIIHSHLFEHIYNFNDFLLKCYQTLGDNGEMFFGIPDMEHIANSDICPFLGIFFEHTCFLNKENIGILLNNNNFDILECINYGNHSILYHCKKKRIPWSL